MRCVGYRHVWQFLDGEIDDATLRATACAATRQLAKRQMTWLRAMPRMQPIDCFANDAKDVIELAAARLSLAS
jgi:tRNA dimethylallyltransferase